MTKTEDEKLEEAREIMLQYYSSKASLQATIIVSLAIAFFAFIQTIPLFEKWYYLVLYLYYSLALTAFIFLTTRAVGRLKFYGDMSGLAERLKIISNADLEKELEEKESREKRIIDVSAYVYRVEYACHKFLSETSKVNNVFYRLTGKRTGILESCLILFLGLFIFYLLSPYYLLSPVVILIMACIFAFYIHRNFTVEKSLRDKHEN